MSTTTINIIGWLLHFVVVAYAWPMLRDVWRDQDFGNFLNWGQRQLAWAAITCLPIVSWPFLVGYRIAHQRAARQAEEHATGTPTVEQRVVDVKFWREQRASGDPVAAMVAEQLLDMWGVPHEEPEHDPGQESDRFRETCDEDEFMRALNFVHLQVTQASLLRDAELSFEVHHYRPPAHGTRARWNDGCRCEACVYAALHRQLDH